METDDAVAVEHDYQLTTQEFATKNLLQLLQSKTVDTILGKNVHIGKSEYPHILIENQTFDFTDINEHAEKAFEDFVEATNAYIFFQGCEFIGALKFRSCNFEQVRFYNCVFKKPKNAIWPDSRRILDFKNIGPNTTLIISGCVFDTSIELWGKSFDELRLNEVKAPTVFVDGITTSGGTLTIKQSSTTRIEMPRTVSFDQVICDTVSLRSLENAEVHTITIPKKSVPA